MLEAFDYPEMGPNCLTRSVSVVSPQALLMLNNDHVRELAAAFADRVQSIVDESSPRDPDRCATQIDTVYKLALNRQPSDEERCVGIEALHTLQAEWQGDEHAALTTYCHIILNSASFLYID